MLNIPQNVNDAFYRYRREKVKLSNQKLGFKIDNLESIGKAIYLNPKTIMKYFQKTFGCQSKNDVIYNKNINSNVLDDALEDLIQKIICDKCNNPEIKFSKKKKKLNKNCQACGHEYEIIDDEFKKILINEG